MSMYRVPPDTKEKEKIIGGILNLQQFFWVLGGLAIGALIFTLTFPIFGLGFSLFLTLVGVSSSLPFVFYKKNGLTLFELIKYTRQHNKKTHFLPNVRTERFFVAESKGVVKIEKAKEEWE